MPTAARRKLGFMGGSAHGTENGLSATPGAKASGGKRSSGPLERRIGGTGRVDNLPIDSAEIVGLLSFCHASIGVGCVVSAGADTFSAGGQVRGEKYPAKMSATSCRHIGN